MTVTDRWADLVGTRLPVVQAPMAGVSSPALAAAVSKAGGLGSLGLGSSDAATARRMIRATRALDSGPLNVNVFCHRPDVPDANRTARWLATLKPHFDALGAEPPSELREIYKSFLADDDMLDMLLDERPSIVSFHFGLPPRATVEALKKAGCILMASATNLREGRLIAAAGLHAVIAQGWEAGGHRGMFEPLEPDDRIGVFALVRLLVRDLDLPVIAAGGIMDGAAIAAVLRLGAAAAQLGTAFVVSDESLADAGYRAAMASDAALHTVMTRAISGRPARSLANDFTALGAAVEDDSPGYPFTYDAGKALHAAGRAKGRHGYGAQWAGQGAPLARPMAAASLVATLDDEMRAALCS